MTPPTPLSAIAAIPIGQAWHRYAFDPAPADMLVRFNHDETGAWTGYGRDLDQHMNCWLLWWRPTAIGMMHSLAPSGSAVDSKMFRNGEQYELD